MPTLSKRTVIHYSPEANWFVGDAEPYGFCREFMRFQVAPVSNITEPVFPERRGRRSLREIVIYQQIRHHAQTAGASSRHTDNKYFSFLSGRPRRVAPTVFPLISDVFRNAEDSVPYETIVLISGVFKRATTQGRPYRVA